MVAAVGGEVAGCGGVDGGDVEDGGGDVGGVDVGDRDLEGVAGGETWRRVVVAGVGDAGGVVEGLVGGGAGEGAGEVDFRFANLAFDYQVLPRLILSLGYEYGEQSPAADSTAIEYESNMFSLFFTYSIGR